MDLNIDLNEKLKQLKARPNLSLAERISLLKKLKTSILANEEVLITALSDDFGYRNKLESFICDINPLIKSIDYNIKRLPKWVKNKSCNPSLQNFPSKLHIQYQPFGVIGIISSWNYPVLLSISPLVSALAAGNKAMLKLSEFTPKTNKIIETIINDALKDIAVVITGDYVVAQIFSSLPFDHMMFTGSTTTGRKVMQSCAVNLTPVTLELGGKSPVIIAPDVNMEFAVQRMIFGKTINAGQTCVAPDYVFCPIEKIDSFIDEYKKQFKAMYKNKLDHSSIINDRQYARLLELIDDAKNLGGHVSSAIETNVTKEFFATQLITNVTQDMKIANDEIFGPILPILPYSNLEHVITYINERDKPLSLYIMSKDKAIQNQILENTSSGTVAINETMVQTVLDGAPFGGVGASGIGNYHGYYGFLRFSHARTVLAKGKIYTTKLAFPPFNKFTLFLINKILSRLKS